MEAYTHTELINGTLAAQGVFIFCYLISAFVVAGNRYSGFVVVFTGFVFAAFSGFTYYGLRIAISRTIFGAILGSCVIMIIISLETAIFWGQYDDCERFHNNSGELQKTNNNLIGIECNHTSAMKSVCTFAVFIFLSYLFQIALLMRFKEDMLGSAPLNEGYSAVPQSSSLNSHERELNEK